MNQYFAILTPTAKRIFFAWLAVGLLILYLVLPLYPNFSLKGLSLIYLFMQFAVISGLLFPLLLRWRYCQILRLMPFYNQTMKKLVMILFSLFFLLPAFISWLNGYDLWVTQVLSFLLWNLGAYIALRRLTENAPSEKQEKTFAAAIAPIYYLLPTLFIQADLNWVASFISTPWQLLIMICV